MNEVTNHGTSNNQAIDEDLVDVSSGGLRVARQHLLKAMERIQKAEDRLEYDGIGKRRGENGFWTQSALADLCEERNSIEDELDRRDEPYEYRDR